MGSDYRRAAAAWIVVRMIRIGTELPGERLLRLASFLMRENHLTAADLAALPKTLPQTSAAAAQARSGGELVDPYLYRLARVLGRYERRAAAGLAGQAEPAIW